MNPRQEKIHIKNAILKVLQRDRSAKRSVIKSSFKLETGFSDKVIDGIIEDLKNVDLIEIDGEDISLTEKGRVLAI